MIMDFVILIIAVVFLSLISIYWTRFRHHPWDKHYPKLAWLRAGIYFCFCYLFSYLTGTMDKLLSMPIATAEQWQSGSWQLITGAALLYIVLAYAGVWAYFTPTFERKQSLLLSALFGFLWGSSSGQLFLSVWYLASAIDWPVWAAWIATFVALSLYQPSWHNIYWDHYIAPEHDTPLTQKIKVACCHIPNLLIMLTHLAVFGNAWLFLLAQVIACVSAGVAMRFPPPWSAPSELNLANRTDSMPPRCTGYLSEDYLSDPYTPFYPGWKKPQQQPGGSD